MNGLVFPCHPHMGNEISSRYLINLLEYLSLKCNTLVHVQVPLHNSLAHTAHYLKLVLGQHGAPLETGASSTKQMSSPFLQQKTASA